MGFGLTDILTTIQNGVSAVNNLGQIVSNATINSSSLRVVLVPLLPTVTVLTTGSASPYVPPTGTKYIELRMVGAGGGGAGSGTGPSSAVDGANTTFGTSALLFCGGGVRGNASGVTATGGTPLGGDMGIVGGVGYISGLVSSTAVGPSFGGIGGNSVFGGAGATQFGGGAASAGAGNSGAGGGGGLWNGTGQSATGGGAGGYLEKLITVLNSSGWVFAVGSGGTAGGAGAGGVAGGAGGSGLILISEHYSG